MSAIGCSQPERPDAVWPVAGLEAAEQLALEDQHDRHELQADREQKDRFDDLDPPLLVVADDRVGDVIHAFSTSTVAFRTARCPSPGRDRRRRTRCRGGRRAHGGGRAQPRAVGRQLDAARRRRRRAAARPRVRARPADAATRNLSAGEISTSGEAQIGRYVPSRRCPLAGVWAWPRAGPGSAAARAPIGGGGVSLPPIGWPERLLPRRPANAAAADLVEGQPREARDRGGHLLEHVSARQRLEVEPDAPRRPRPAPPSRPRPRRDGRSPSAGAGCDRPGG